MIDRFPMDTTAPKNRQLKTLIVDDNDLVRRGLRHVVESTEGLRLVGEAADVPEALVALCNQEPAIAILDLELPSGSGLDVLRFIRKWNADCRVIMFSGSMTEREAEACRYAGAEHCFNKVLDFDRLRETLHDWGRQPELGPE